jgi:hypothetical protein
MRTGLDGMVWRGMNETNFKLRENESRKNGGKEKKGKEG